MARKIKLSKQARTRIDSFDECAQSHGWESDQGTRDGPAKAKAAYEKAKRRLELLIARRERELEEARQRYFDLALAHVCELEELDAQR